MKRTLTVMAMVMALAMSVMGTALADGHHLRFGDFPSTNEQNRDSEVPGREGQDAPHVNVDEVGVGWVTLEFVNEAPGGAFFEYRIDGEVRTEGTDHPVVIDDVIYPGVGVGFSPPDQTVVVETFEANEKVEIRLALGAERDWDFDWTTFEVLPEPTVDDCRDGGFDDLGFRNQGQCIASIQATDANPNARFNR